MTRLELIKEGMNSTHYAIFENGIYVGESFAYAEDLKNTFEINITWCLFNQPQGNIIDFVQSNEYVLLDDIEDSLNIGFGEYRKWKYNTRVIVEGKVLEMNLDTV